MNQEKDDESSQKIIESLTPSSLETRRVSGDGSELPNLRFSGTSSLSSTRPTPVSSPDPKFLHYGDIIEIFSDPASSKVKMDLNEKTFFVDYIDDQKIRLIQTNTHDTILLYIDENGQLQEPSIKRIDLLTRAKEPGFARQKGLLPDQWVDVYFVNLEQPITGKITHLEEDQIELTLHPSHDIIYIDFSYRGIPEDLPIEKFVLRSSPPLSEPDQEPDQVPENIDESIAEASIEFTPENEAIIRLPENVEYDLSTDEILESEYIEADEIFFGKDREIVEQFMEQTQYEMVFNLDTQLTSMMNELLSTVPNSQRTHEVMTNIHRILDRFKELREQFSLIDDYTHQVRGINLHGLQYQPLADYLVAGTGVPPSWLLPVTQTRRKMYVLPDESAEDFEEMGDTVVQSHDIPELNQIMEKYRDNTLQGDSNPYKQWMEELYPAFTPLVDTPLTTNDGLASRASVLFSPTIQHDSWESIVENSVGGFSFGATTVSASAKHTTLKPTHPFFQRFSPGISFLERSEENRRKFVPQYLTPNETLHIQSWILLPVSVARFSMVQMPMIDLLQRTEMSHKYWLKYRSFPSKGSVDTLLLDNLENTKKKTAESKKKHEHFLTGIQHVLPDPVLVRNQHELPENFYRQYVQTMLPSTFDLIEIVQSWMTPFQGLNIQEQIRVLEPFMVYLSSLSYPHYNRMRYYIKERTSSWKKQFYESKEQYRKINDTYALMNQTLGKGVLGPSEYNLGRKLLEQTTLYQIFYDVYRIRGLMSTGDGVTAFRPLSSSELLQEVCSKDMYALLSVLLRNATLNHVVAESFLKASAEMNWEEDQEDADTKLSKIGGDCRRNFLVKRYTSLADLQKDNYNEDVFYDKNMDDTPYELLDQYKKDMPEKTDDFTTEEMRDFLELLSTNLIKKHACPKDSAAELAITLLSKKKRVKDGEYAMLELATKKREESTADSVKIDDKPLITHREFFKRVQNKWVQDNTLSDESFADLSFLIQSAFPNKRGAVNRMLCDSQPSCMKNPQTATCDPFAASEKRIQIMRQEYAVKEMEKRLETSQEELAKLLETLILETSRTLAAKERLRTVWFQHYSIMAYAMGQITDKDAPPIVVSPYAKLRDDIIGQDDFTKKQYDLVRFFQTGFLRRAMIDELGEDDHWLYCTETNTKLLPVFMYDLAKEFIAHGEIGYQERLETYKQFQMMSDDGDAIVDKHSGYILSKLEWVNEELYDDQGFKIQTGSVLNIDPEEEGFMEQKQDTLGVSMGETIHWSREKQDQEQTDTETMTMVKNIFATFCQILDLDAKEYEKGGFRAFVQRVAMEYIDESVMSLDDFTRQMAKKSSTNTATNLKPQYKKYFNQYVVIITTSIFLIGIQTTTPAIRTKKTVPGCVKSFTGYPLTESMEDQSGIQYMACMLNLVKSSIAPWNSIQSIKKEIIQEKLRDTIQNIVNTRKDLYELYLKQQQYREEHPEEFTIPEEHQLQKWRTLLPPSVEIDIVSRLSRERPPANDVIAAESHIIRYGYGIIESIHKVVQTQDVLLTTALGIPFVQNACCDQRADVTQNETTLQFFVREAPVVQTFMNHIMVWEKQMEEFRKNTTAITLVFTDDTRIKRVEVTSGKQEEIIYSAFIHFCHYDRVEFDIPLYLQGICATKPVAEKYRHHGSIQEKIQDLKEAGRTFRWEDFEQLLRLVNAKNRIQMDFNFVQPSAVKVLTEFLAESTESTVEDPFLDPIRAPLLEVLVKYDPQIMLMEDVHNEEEDSMYTALNNLMNVLGPLNQTRRERILRFLPKGAERTRAERRIDSWTLWTPTVGDEAMYEMSQFVKNAVVFMVKILPPMMFNNQFVKEWNVPSHWGLTETHQGVIVKFLQQTHGWFAKFSNSGPTESRFFTLLREWQAGLLPLVQFTQLLPIHLPIHKDGNIYFRLFPKDMIHQWMQYVSLSVLDHLVVLCQKLPNIMGAKNIKDTSAKWIMALLDMFSEDKDIVDMSYKDIMKKVHKSRDEEKTRVMNEFRNVNNTDRRYMYMEKMFKLNRWNMESKDVFKYNGKQFDKELAEFTDDTLEQEFPEDPHEEGYDMDDEDDDYGHFNYDGEDAE